MNFLLIFPLLEAFSYAHEISQVHISLTNSDSSIVVQWAVDEIGVPLCVRFWKKSIKDFASVNSTCRKFKSVISDPGSREMFTCYSKLEGLESKVFYEYQIGSEEFGWGKTYEFQGKRTENDAKFIMYGDFGIGEQTIETISSIKLSIESDMIDGVIHIGDIAYDLHHNEGRTGDLFLQSIEPIASQVPYMVSHGNHERGDSEIHYKNRFAMPGNSRNLWYSFNYGSAHFITYTQEFLFGKPTERKQELLEMQLNFIENDLKTLDRSKYPWVIVYTHRPFYCSSSQNSPKILYYEEEELQYNIEHLNNHKDCGKNAEKVRKVFEKLWHKYDVDLIFTAHVHNYERFHPTYKSKHKGCSKQTNHFCKNAKAPIHIITGVPGNQESYAPSSFVRLPTSAFQTSRLSFGKLHIINEKHLRWEQVSSDSREILDYLDLEK